MSFANALSLFTIQGICVNPLLLTFNHYMFIMLVFMAFLVCLEVWIVFIGLGVVIPMHGKGNLQGVIRVTPQSYLKLLCHRNFGFGMPFLVLAAQTTILMF